MLFMDFVEEVFTLDADLGLAAKAVAVSNDDARAKVPRVCQRDTVIR